MKSVALLLNTLPASHSSSLDPVVNTIRNRFIEGSLVLPAAFLSSTQGDLEVLRWNASTFIVLSAVIVLCFLLRCLAVAIGTRSMKILSGTASTLCWWCCWDPGRHFRLSRPLAGRVQAFLLGTPCIFRAAPRDFSFGFPVSCGPQWRFTI